ncbi:Hypothetical protein POVR1_LOCUS363 [uncultured virus]|nr:Hypothetical protein POVR1_LOCUS363 [uncultured virus]
MLLLIVSMMTCAVGSPSLLSAKKYSKEGLRIFDDSYDVGLWDLQFNESLYTYQGYGSEACFQNRSCYPSTIQCPLCDWTDPEVCAGTKRGTNSTCPCGPPPILCFRNLWPYEVGFWSRNATSTIVDVMSIKDVAYYPLPPNNCSCIIFKIDVMEGEITGILLYYGDRWLGAAGGPFILSRHGTATVCPSDPLWAGTYLIRVFTAATVSSAKVNVSIEYRNISPAVTSSCDLPSDLISTHQCLSTNLYTTLIPPVNATFLRVMINPAERCGVIGFWASSGVHLLSTDPWVSPKNASKAFRTHRVGPSDGRVWPSIYPYCLKTNESLYAFVLTSLPVKFMIDTKKEWMLHRPLSDFRPADYYRKLLGAMSVHCSNRTFIAHNPVYTVTETMETGSGNLRAMYPSDDLDLFYPPPTFASKPYYSVRDLPLKPMTDGRFVVSLYLRQRLSTRSQPVVWLSPWFQNSYQWVSIADDWDQCILSIDGLITGRDGLSLQLKIENSMIDEGLPNCRPALYLEASKEIDEIQRTTNQLISEDRADIDTVYRLWFLQGRLFTSNAFYTCQIAVQSYYTRSLLPPKQVETTECVSAFGSSEFEADPCCTLNNQTFYDSCVQTERSLHEQYKIIGYTQELQSCSSIECAKASLTNLVLQLNSNEDPTACINSVDRPDDANVYWRCIHEIWGTEPVTFAGPRCRHDQDCQEYGSQCDVYSKRCFIDVATAEIALVSCIYDNVTQFTRNFIANSLQINAADPAIKTLWLVKFSQTLPCSDPSVPVGFNLMLASYGKCYGCDRYLFNTTTYNSNWALSPGPSWPNFGHDCWAQGSSDCSITTSSYGSDSYCVVRGCNNIPYENYGYFPYVTESFYCVNNTYCGITDDNFFYSDVTDVISLANCENSILCLLANGTKIQTGSAAECRSIFSCDVSCLNGPCLTAAECEDAGSCSDATDEDIGIWTRIFEDELGGCFFTIRYRTQFNPTVEVCETPFRNTIIGCSVYPGVGSIVKNFSIDEVSCRAGTFEWGNPLIFELINPRWITPAKTVSQCNDYGNVCMNPNKPMKAGLHTYTNIYTFNDQCEGASARSLFQWTSGRWLEGQPRIAHVTIGSLKRRFSNVSRVGLNLPKILGNITESVNKLQSLKIQSTAFCRGAYKRSLDELVCSCMFGYNDSVCYSDIPNVTNSIAVACDESDIIYSGDLEIEFSTTSLPVATCDNIFIITAPIIDYRSRTITPLRTLLVNYEEDTEYAIRNHRLGIYGKVLTNGYAATFTQPINNVTLCIQLSLFRDNYNLDRYSVIDLAFRSIGSFQDSLIPLNMTIIENDKLFCAHLETFEKEKIYYFIQRLPQNFTTVSRDVFSTGEIVYMSILLALYLFGLIMSVVKFFYVFYVYAPSENSYPIRFGIVLALMGAFFAFRVVLFFMLLNQALLSAQSSRAVNYLLFEFPILLYFAFVTNYICIWINAFLMMKAKKINSERPFLIANAISVLVNVVIFVLFIIIIVLFETIIFQPYLICGGSILVFDTEKSFNLLLAYRIIFSAIAIVIGIALLMAGVKYGHELSNPEYQLSKKTLWKLYTLSIVGGLGLIGQAIYFLVVTATNSTPQNYVSLSILLLLEIIPALMFVFVESVRNPSQKKLSGKSTSSKSFGQTPMVTPD